MIEKVWVLFGNTGEYSDHQEWVVRAYLNEADADADMASLNEMAKDGNVLGYAERGAIVSRLRQHDQGASMDYTGTNYFVAEVPVSSATVVPGQTPGHTPTPKDA